MATSRWVIDCLLKIGVLYETKYGLSCWFPPCSTAKIRVRYVEHSVR
jgi:hypothetical protein